jgi:peroxiredoxin (alkyl hydroperoxide reductase subunit C)
VTPLAAGTPAPDFSLGTEDGGRLTLEDLKGQTTVLVFYPFAFSPVCTGQLNLYEDVLAEFTRLGATLYGVSCDASWSQKAFREQLGVTIPQLSDFEPKGEVCRAFGVWLCRAGARDHRPRRHRELELPGPVAR